jgi:transposase-like protein
MDRDALQLLLAQGVSVEQIGRRFGRHPSTVAYWMRKHGLEAPNRAKHAAKGGIEPERLTELIARGMTIAEIADEVGLSKGAVRHWLGRYGLQTNHRRGRRSGPDSRDAKQAGRLEIRMTCVHHGETDFLLEGRGSYRCKLCRSEAVSRRRRRLKATLVADAGGQCCLCGYSRHVGALHFHHVDPGTKRMNVSAGRVAYRLDTLRQEARKCVLLCSNCHAEVEAGVIALPLHLAERIPISTDSTLQINTP